MYLIPYNSDALAATVAFAWDKNSESDLAGYRIHYGSSSRNYNYSVDVGNYTSCTISGLEEGETYYFAVTAYDEANNESNFSEELILTIPVGDTQILEAEEMSYHANGIQVGEYWLLWSNGTMNEEVHFPNTGTYRIEITAKADLAYGLGPEMELLIDGQSKGSVFVNSNTPEIFVFEVEVSAGWHDLAISYNNNLYDPAQGIDRNLYVDQIAISYYMQ